MLSNHAGLVPVRLDSAGAGCSNYVPTHCQDREKVLDVGAKLKEPNGGPFGGLGYVTGNRKGSQSRQRPLDFREQTMA